MNLASVEKLSNAGYRYIGRSKSGYDVYKAVRSSNDAWNASKAARNGARNAAQGSSYMGYDNIDTLSTYLTLVNPDTGIKARTYVRACTNVPQGPSLREIMLWKTTGESNRFIPGYGWLS